jgi:high-affinity iron transporter
MLQALIISLREGVEAALIIGITVAYLVKIGRPELKRIVYAALGAAIVASLAVALLLSTLDYPQEIFEGTVMLVAAFFVLTMVWFMSRAAKTLKGDIEKKVGSFAGTGSKIGLFLFVFLMVVREGVETVLILSAVTFTTSHLLGFLATLTGVAISVAFGVMFVRGSVKVNLPKFFRVTTVILIFVAIQLLVSGVHELSEAGLVPSSRRQMAIIGPIVRNDVFFFITILALAALMVLFESRSRVAVAPATGSTAEQRKAAWSARRERLWTSAVYVSAFIFIVLVTGQFIYAKSTTALSPAMEITLQDGKAVIPTSDMREGDLRRYTVQLNGNAVRFLLYKKPDGSVATIMDACTICGDTGFYNSGAQGITCKNCDAPVNPQSVGQGGGCNPIPLESTTDGNSVTITAAQITAAASHMHTH